jgi:hypothetical protein
MTESQAYFTNKLKEITALYVLIKEIVVFLEKYNKGGYAYLGPHNEVRNAFDHVMKMSLNANDTDAVEKQYNSAKNHLLRAGYDAYELLCSNCIQYIYNTLNFYKPSDINNGFPDFYQKSIRANIIEIQKELTSYRMRHPAVNEVQDMSDHDVTSTHELSEVEKGQQLYEYYHKSFDKLLNYSDDMDAHVSAMSDFRTERIKKSRLNIAALFVGIGGFIVAIITLFLC